MPDLVRVVSPDTEAELAAIVEMLEAHEVPCFVCDARLGWVSSGVHGCVRKPRIVMVPGTRVAEAAALLADLKSSRAGRDDVARKHFSSRLCALVRFIWFGWYRPVARNFK
jgi:hypothetical protein